MSDLNKIQFGAGYVSSTAAAAAFGVTNDYIARLCRNGKVRGVLEGRVWLVETKSLTAFFGRELPGDIGSPFKIYYKDAPTIPAEHASRPSVSSNPAMISVFPQEARAWSRAILVPRPVSIFVARTAIIGVLLLSVGGLGYGSILNHVPAYSMQSSQVAAASSGGFFSGVSNTARAVAGRFDSLMYNLFYDHETSMPVVIVQKVAAKPEAPAPIVAAPVVQKTTDAPTVINYPVTERVIERERLVVSGGVTEAFLQSNLDALDTKLRSLIFASSASASAGTAAVYNVVSQTNRIDNLGDVDMTDSRITNSTITNSRFVNATLSGTTSLDVVALGSATTTSGGGFDISNGCYAVNGACITGSGAGTPGGSDSQVQFNDEGTFAGSAAFLFSTTSLRLTVTNASTTNLSITGKIDGAGLSTCSGSLDKIQYNSATGQFVCGTDQTGGGGGSDTNWSFFNNAGLRPATTTNQVLIGGIATTSNAKLQVIGGAVVDNATSTTLNTNLLGIGGTNYFSSLTGSGLINSAGTLTVHQGQAFSTTSAAYNLTTYDKGYFFSTTSTDYWKTQNNFFSTTSNNFYTAAGLSFSTTSSSYFLAQNTGNAFSTTSALFFSSVGLAHATSSVAYQLTQTPVMTNGLLAYASSTIGSGTQTGGLTISGGATTTSKFFVGTSTNSSFYFDPNSTELLLSVKDPTAQLTFGSGQFDVTDNGSGAQFAFNTGTESLTVTGSQNGVTIDALTSSGNILNVDNVFSVSNTQATVESGIVFRVGLGASESRFTVLANENVGIGTSTPTSKLSIFKQYGDTQSTLFSIASSTNSANNTNATLFSVSGIGFGTTTVSGLEISGSATSTSNVGFNISTGCYAVNGTCISSGGSSSFAWTPTTNFGTTTNATTTPIWFQAGLQASSTAHLTNVNLSGSINFATSSNANTLLSRNGTPLLVLNGGAGNIVFTDASLASLTTGSDLTAFGAGALAAVTSGSENTAIGFIALSANTTGSNNTALGSLALSAATSASNNTAIGMQALERSTAGANNVAVGSAALQYNTTGSDNIGIGYQAIGSDLGSKNVGIGTLALLSNTSGNGNVAVGYNAGYGVSSGSNNVFIGNSAGYNLLSSSYNNIIIGESVTNLNNTNSNIGIGNNITFANPNGNRQLNIGGLIMGTLPATTTGIAFNLPTSGTIGIGTTSPFSKFGIALNSGDTVPYAFMISSSTASATTTLFSVDNNGIVSLNHNSGTTTLLKYEGANFIKSNTSGGNTSIGWGAMAVGNTNDTAVGYQALGNNSGGHNTAIGYQALINDSGGNNVAVGESVLGSSAQGGFYNVGVGHAALQLNTTGGRNVAIGGNALNSNTVGSSIVAIGDSALQNSMGDGYNVAIGASASVNNMSATNTVAMGYRAARGNASYNAQGYTAVGYQAGTRIATGGDFNTLFGYQAGSQVTSGLGNILIGAHVAGTATNNVTTGSGNIGLGNELYFPSATANNQLNIGNLIFGTLPATTTGWRLPTSGTIGIGTTSPTSKFGIAANNGDTLTTLFQISSSTSNSTTTLFSISNTGSVVATTSAGDVLTFGVELSSPTQTNGFGYRGREGGQLTFDPDGTFIAQSLSSNSSLAFGATGALQIVAGGIGLTTLDVSSTGFGTTTLSGLRVNGQATSTSNVGFNITTGCYAVNGTCLTSGGSSASSTLLASDFNTFANQLNISSQNGLLINGIAAVAGSTTLNNYYFGGATTSANNYGTYNYAIGQYAMANATTTVFGDNFAVGYQALMGSTTVENTGADNNALGYQALSSNTTGTSNNAIGYGTLRSNTDGTDNNAFGQSALTTNTTGQFNNAIGRNALKFNTTGSGNNAIGTSALVFNTTGQYNVALGDSTLASNTTGDNNVAIGRLALRNVTTGASNIMIGGSTVQTGGITTGVGNVGLGSNVFFASTTANSQLNIGNLIFGTLPATSTAWTLPTSGTIGIGTTSPTSKFGIALNNGDTLPYAFMISSSTANSTSTLFVVDNTGRVTIGNVSPVSTSTQLSLLAGSTTVNFAGSISTSMDGPRIFAVQGRYAYIPSDLNNTFSIFDVSNPATPLLMASTSVGLNNPAALAVQGRYAYVINNNGAALTIFDISNPAAPFLVGTTRTGLTAPRHIAVQGKYAYVASFNAGLVIFDVSNPASPVKVSTLSLSSAKFVTVQGQYAYLSAGLNALTIVDISNPTLPVQTGTVSTGLSNPSGIAIQGRYAYVTSANNNAFVIFDVSNPASPTQVSTISTSINTPISVSVQGRYAYVVNQNTNRLVTFDVSNPALPTVANIISTGLSAPQSVVVQGRHAYVTNQNNDALVTFDLGGAYIQQLETGGIETGTLAVNGPLQAESGIFWGGLNIQQSLNVTGGGNFLSYNSIPASTAVASTSALSATGVDTFTRGISDVLSITHLATSTSAAGIGTGLLFNDTTYCSLTDCVHATTTATSSARIASVLTSVSTTSPASALAFFTKNSANGLSEWMRLTSTGNLGLGTSTPTSNLSVFKQYGNANNELFSIASSTNAAGSTNTPFLSVSSTGFGTTTLSGLNISGSATSTSNVGFNITAGCYAVNGTCLTGGSGVSVSGDNTWTGANIFQASTTIGNGTAAGGLTISGGATTTGALIVTGTSASSTFAGNVEIAGGLKVGTGSIYLNGSATSTFSHGIQASALDITGSASSTFANGFNITTGCFAVGGTCLTAGASGSGGGQLLATYATSTPGSNVSVNFNGASGSAPSYSAGTLTLPSNTSYVVVETWGGGGGGGGVNTGGAGGTGGQSCFGTNATACTTPLMSATGGLGGSVGGAANTPGGIGGSATGGDINLSGQGGAGGTPTIGTSGSTGGMGGSSPRGGGGGRGNGSTDGGAFGGGGAGAYTNTSGETAGGGAGGGGYSQKLITSPSGTYYYTVGVGGAGGTSGGGSGAGGAGGVGGLVISVYTTGISNGSVASGQAGQFAYFDATGTNLSATSNIFSAANGHIGIGTTSPWGKLSISTTAQQDGTLPLFNIASTTNASIFSVLGNGNVGIGVASPSYALDVSGTLHATGATTLDSTLSTGAITINSGGAGTASLSVNPSGRLTLNSSDTISGAFNFTFGGTSAAILQANGNLGIGTTTPGAKLTIAKATAATNADGILLTADTLDFRLFAETAAVGAGYIGTESNHGLRFFTNGSSNVRMTVGQDGNVGIGTTTIGSKLIVADTSATQYAARIFQDNGTDSFGLLVDAGIDSGDYAIRVRNRALSSDLFNVKGDGNVSIGSAASAAARVRILYNDNTNDGIYLQPTDDDTATPIVFRNTASGVAGTITQTTSAVAYNTTSDRRVKENIAPTTLNLDTLMRLPVREFSFTSDATHATTTGFIAQELYEVFPWAVTTNGDNGTDALAASSTVWSVDYGRITPLLVKSIQDLNLKVDARTGALIAASFTDIAPLSATTTASEIVTASSTVGTTTPWIASFSTSSPSLMSRISNLADTVIHIMGRAIYATVGIFESVFAKDITADRVTAQQLCIDDVCVTKEQLQALLAGAAGSGSSAGGGGGGGGGGNSAPAEPPVDSGEPAPDGSTSSPQDTEAPVVSVNGANPTEINVGQTYSDLGASVTDNVDNNLGITYTVDGTDMLSVQIDSSVAGTHTIVYTATDTAGNVGTASRTVTVSDPAPAPAPEPTPEPTPTDALEPTPPPTETPLP